MEDSKFKEKIKCWLTSAAMRITSNESLESPTEEIFFSKWTKNIVFISMQMDLFSQKGDPEIIVIIIYFVFTITPAFRD